LLFLFTGFIFTKYRTDMRSRLYILFTTVLFSAAFLLPALEASAQADKGDVIQFSGMIVTEDSTMAIPGVHVYVPKGGRGTTTNPYGYFSFPALEGDSVLMSAVGFKRKYIQLPEIEGDSYTVMIALEEDTTLLAEQIVRPLPSEEMFKEMVLAMRSPHAEALSNMDENLNPATLAMIARNMPMDGSMNHRYFVQTQSEYLFDGSGPRPNPLLNPFAWADFFKSLKKKK
jgi:hypothetical protein